MKLAYDTWAPRGSAAAVVRTAEAICAEYRTQGYDLTLRQLYYQFVARDLIANTQQSYKRLGDIVNRARLAGLLDWSYIVDRTRNLRGTSHWSEPSDVINSAAASYRIDKWADQPARVEVWVEKEALAGIVQRAAGDHDVDWFSCRGYVSQSELWAAARRHLRYLQGGQRVVVLHLGDHDPSGIDMTRDVADRLNKFVFTDWWRDHEDEIEEPKYAAISEHILEHLTELRGDSPYGIEFGHEPIEVRRIALNRDQIDRYQPPPNPAKLTDSRVGGYLAEHGNQSWELDALDPTVLGELIASHIEEIRVYHLYDQLAARETRERATLREISDNYDDIADRYSDPNGDQS